MKSKTLTHASFFSGQGGFDLASEWMGWENLLQCEINTFCQHILKYYWPNATIIEDITQANFSFWRGTSEQHTRCDDVLRYTTNSNGLRLWRKSDRQRESRFFSKEGAIPNWENFPTQSPICTGDDGISSRLDLKTILKVIKRKVTKAFKPFN